MLKQIQLNIRPNVAKGVLQRAFLLLSGKQLNLALADQALVSGTNFLTGLLLARYMGVDEYGRYTLAWMFVLFANMVQIAFILQPMMSIAPQQPEQELPGYMGAVVLQQAVLSVLLALLVFLAVSLASVYFPKWGIGDLAFPVSVTVFAFQCQDFIRRYFFAKRKIAMALLNDGISYGLQVAILLALFFSVGAKSDSVLWIVSLTSFIAFLAGMTKMEHLEWGLERFQGVLMRHWHFSKWVSLGSVMQFVGGQYFVVVPSAMFSSAAAGAIAAARNVVGISLIICAAAENIVSVQASVAYASGGWDALKRYILKVSIVGGLANGLFCLLGGMFAPYWMGLLFGDAYVPYAYLVYWFAVTHFLMFFIRPLAALLRSLEVTRPIAASSLLPFLLSVIASVPLVRQFGIVGSMIVMLGMTLLTVIHLLWASLACRKGFQR